MGHKKTKGFTLIEMMVVITIIAIVAGIAIVAVNGALFEARKKACGVNMFKVFQALAVYATANSADFPQSLEFSDLIQNGPLAQIPPGKPSLGANCLFLLYNYELAEAGYFLCPAQNHSTKGLQRIPNEELFKADVFTKYNKSIFDNSAPKGDRFCDYGFDPRHRQGGESGNVIILADRPPNEKEKADFPKNSPNHNGKGQNIVLINGKVEWMPNTDCGIDKDEIYQLNPALGAKDSCCMP